MRDLALRFGGPRQLAVALAVMQSVDALGNALVSPRYLDAHFEHLGVPPSVRRLLQPIKVASSVALLVGTPRLRAAAAAGLVAYYAAAVRFHQLAGDHPIVCAPAAGLGSAAAVLVVRGSGLSGSVARG